MTRKIIELACIGLGIALFALTIDSWVSARRDERQLRAALADQQKTISGATAREARRDETVKALVGDIANLKKKIRTPAQVIQQMPKYLQLPQPITMSNSAPISTPEPKSVTPEIDRPRGQNETETSSPLSGSSAKIPTADLKPLFDFVQDCRACQAEIAAAHRDAVDEGTKLMAMTHERDLAIKAAKGGSTWRRFRRNLGWFAAGIAVGFATRHL
ncbi:MAG TPA: hypothetical protein VMB47_12320 [Candidatus Aquilonibacter sp.]|nr:hypothetical protein [Candidatus Aquilonibacter sp.]